MSNEQTTAAKESPLAEVPQETPGHGLLAGRKVVVTAAAGTGIGFSTARRVLLAALGSRRTNVRGLAVEQLAALGPACAAWAKAPLEKLARSGKGAELLEPIASALGALEQAR